MSGKITVTANIDVQSGPNIKVSQVVPVQAFELIDVEIKKDESKDINVPIETDKANLLTITTSTNWYGDGITYTVMDFPTSANPPTLKLNQPVLLLGNDVVKMLHSKSAKLTFSYKKQNEKDPESVEIQILMAFI